MKTLAIILRYVSKLKFRLLGHATIKDIPTDEFEVIIKKLTSHGWCKTYEYKGFDAWIDYGKLKLKKDHQLIILEWDNWTEGSIEGKKKIIEAFGREFGFKVSPYWRWSEYDENLNP